MTDTRLSQVKVGDVVQRKYGASPCRVLRLHADGVEGYSTRTRVMLFAPTDELDLPDPPKAKAGVTYRRLGTYALGTHDGRLKNTAWSKAFDYTPDWLPVELK